MKKRFLRDIAEIQTGPFGSQLHKEDYVDVGTPIVTVEHLGCRVFSEQNLPMVSDTDKSRLSKYVLKKGDIVFSRVGSVDRCSFVGQKHDGWMFSGRCLRVRPSEEVDSLFLYYFFCLNTTKEFVRSIAVGATMPSINTKLLGEVEVVCPEIEEQRKIADILSKIDDKIEENQKINENLEQQAQSLFIEMFDSKESNFWKQGVLSDIAEITMGQSPSGNSYNENGQGTVFFQGRAEFGFRFPTIRLFTSEPKRIAQKNDTLMSVRAPVGDLNVAHEECCIGRGLAAIHSKDNHQSFVHYTMFSLQRELDVFNGEGTVFGSINRNALNSMPIRVPPIDLMDKFENIASPIDKLIRTNFDENCHLQAIRDSILPKLMAGEIDLSNFKL